MKHKIDTDKIDREAFRNVRNEKANEADTFDNNELIEVFEDLVPEEFYSIPGMTKEKGIKLSLQIMLAKLGVTPEEYAGLYDMFQEVYPQNGNGNPTDNDKFVWEELLDMQPDNTEESHKDNSKALMTAAAGKTLVLKVQMKGITKPPMWREVEVPASYTFEDLHDVIQELTGLCHEHLWQFSKKAYDQGMCISQRSNDPFDGLIDDVSDEASETLLIKYLAKKGDTLEYVYDFGDDWIFTVTVLKVLDKTSEKPVCTKYKSEFNAFEDLGGPYVYNELRAYADPNSEMTAKVRKEVENEYGSYFDGKKYFIEWIGLNRFNIEEVNKYFADEF